MEPGKRMSEDDCIQMSSLALAYVGDAVYDQYVRTGLALDNPKLSAHALHRLASRIVCASAQANAVMAIHDALTPDEEQVYRRGRNTHSATVPKNADVVLYRMATGFEAVLGYLYLTGKHERLNDILWQAREAGRKENGNGKDKP
jgi:ribonuclease-3 family protein